MSRKIKKNNPRHLELYPFGWRDELRALINEAKKEMIIVSPYIRKREAEFVVNLLPKSAHIIVITHISKDSLLSGALEIEALKTLIKSCHDEMIINLKHLHAKIYIADKNRAIITSANLTTSGIDRNYEYGVGISHRADIRRICKHVDKYQNSGGIIRVSDLTTLSAALDNVSKKQSVARTCGDAEKELQKSIASLDNKCHRLQGGENKPITLFKKAIRYFLRQRSMTTHELYEEIEAVYPDLCANNIDYITNGHNYGKKWKHYLRAAQQGLKKSGEIDRDLKTTKWYMLNN